jgi:autotransporter-associated beta strand protein
MGRVLFVPYIPNIGSKIPMTNTWHGSIGAARPQLFQLLTTLVSGLASARSRARWLKAGLLVLALAAFVTSSPAALISYLNCEDAAAPITDQADATTAAATGAGQTYGIASAPAGTYGVLTLPGSLGNALAIGGNNSGAWQFSSTDSAKYRSLSNNFTVMAWVFVPAGGVTTANTATIIGPDPSWLSACWYFGLKSTGRIHFTVAGVADYDTANNMWQAGVWQHIAVTKSSTGGLTFYTNGIVCQVIAGATANCPTAASGQFGIARLINTATYCFNNGLLLDEMRVYNTILTASDVQAAALAPFNLVPRPGFSPVAGTYSGPQSVTLSSESGSTVYYTTDGSTPTTSSPSGASPVTIAVSASGTVRAYATKAGKTDSTVASASYTIVQLGVWTNLNGGSWATAANWSNNIIVNSTDARADFTTLSLPTNATVTLDSAFSAGILAFDDKNSTKHSWALNAGSGGPLTLAVSSGSPTITNIVPTTIGAALAGSQGLTKSGSGMLTLAGNNTYTGGTTNTAGTLVLSGANSYAGGTMISGGVVQVGAGGASGDLGSGSVTVASIGSPTAPALLFNRNDSPTLNNTFITSGGGNGYWGAAAGTSVNLAGPLLATNGYAWFCGPGTVRLSNATANDFTSFGAVLCNGVVLEFPSAAVFNNIGIRLFINGSGGGTFRYIGTTNETLALNPSFGIASSTNAFDVANPAAALTVSSTLLNNGGTSGITKKGPGTLILTATSTYTGATVVSNGTLEVDGSIGTGAVTVSPGATLTGIGSINGATTIQAGGRLVAGESSLGALFLNNALSLAGTTQFRIDKTGGTLLSDQLVGMTGVTYGGTLRVTNTTSDTNVLAAGDVLSLFNKSSGTYSGTFSNYDLPPLGPGLSWDKSYLTQDGTLRVANTVGTPVFSPGAGGYSIPLSVSITADAGSTIYYTTDGSDPTTSGTRVSGPSPITGIQIPLNTNVTIQAYAKKASFGDSPVANAIYYTLGRPTWVAPYGGSWADGNSWSNTVIANGAATPADFSSLLLFGDAQVTLDGTWTVGGLAFADQGSAYNWSLAPGSGGTLNLDNGVLPPSVGVSNQTTSIGVTLAGTNGFVKTGGGTLALAANNTLSGGVTVNAGTLLLAQTNANNYGTANSVIGGGPLTVNSGAVVQKAAHFQVSGLNNSNNTSHVVINGGTFEFGGYQEYLRTIDLTGGTINGTNGADHIIIRAPADLTINSSASPTTSTIDGFGIGKIDLTFGNLILNVADGSAATDLLITAHISEDTGAGSGSKSLTKTGAGTLVLAGTNTYTGPTFIQGGTVQINGSLGTNSVTVDASATLGGTGTIGGSVVLNGTISPGASVGTLTSGSEIWNGGGAYRFELYSATNSGASDLLNIAGTLDLEATAGNKFTIRLASMSDATTPGLLPDFNSGATYHWTVATASGGILNFDPAAFNIDRSAFSNAYTGAFSLAVQGNSLVLSYGTTLTPPTLTGYGPLTGSSFPLTFSGPSGQSYKVYFSTNVSQPLSSWSVLTSGTFGGTPVTYTHTSATNSRGFYRVGSP